MPSAPLATRPAFQPVIMPPARVYVPPPRQRSADELAAEQRHAEARQQTCKNSPDSRCEVAGLVCIAPVLALFSLLLFFTFRSPRP